MKLHPQSHMNQGMERLETVGLGASSSSAATDSGPYLHPMLARAFASFEEAQLAWCLLRAPANLAAPSGDVDILVEPGGLSRAHLILRRQGFVRRRVWRRPEAFFLTFDLRANAWRCLHVTERLDFGPHHALHAGAAEACLARSERVGSVRVLCQDDLFWVLLLHSLLDKGKILPKHQSAIQESAKRSSLESPLALIVGHYCPTGWSPERLLQGAVEGNWSQLESLIPLLHATWASRQPHQGTQILQGRIGSRMGNLFTTVSSSGPVRTFGRALVRLHATFQARMRPPGPDPVAGANGPPQRGGAHKRGVTIALLGPDGVGKSTIAASIASSAGEQVRCVHMGLGPRHSPRIAAVRFPALRLGLYVLILWRRYLLARWHQARGRIVVFDRYTYDAVRMDARQGWRQRIKQSVWLHLCPAPDIIVVLDAPATIIHARKAESSPEQLERDRRQFLALQELRTNVWIVDATRPPELIRNDILKLIQQCATLGYESR